MDSKANLKKYIKVDGKWRFVPVQKLNGVPYPGTVLIDGVPVRSTTGTFYLEFYEAGRRVQRPVGSSSREAKDAWYQHCNPEKQSGPDFDEENAVPELTLVRTAFERFLEEVKATKEPATYNAYRDVRAVDHIAISPGAVPRFLERFAQVYGGAGRADSIVSTAGMHHRLVWIHPFMDGNG